MNYSKSWGRFYAAEAIKRHESQFGADADMNFAEYVVTCEEGAALARRVGEQCGDEKTVSIADTVIGTINDHFRENFGRRIRSYRKITRKQQYALAVALLERYGNARGIGAAIWELTDQEIDEADI